MQYWASQDSTGVSGTLKEGLKTGSGRAMIGGAIRSGPGAERTDAREPPMTNATITEPTSDAIVDGRYVILSIDGHAGAEMMTYRDYLSSKYHAEFDEWAKTFVNPFADLRSETAYRNWDSPRR